MIMWDKVFVKLGSAGIFLCFDMGVPDMRPGDNPRTPSSRCRRYVSAHWSPTGRWLRKHVQERDGLWGVQGVVMRRH